MTESIMELKMCIGSGSYGSVFADEDTAWCTKLATSSLNGLHPSQLREICAYSRLRTPFVQKVCMGIVDGESATCLRMRRGTMTINRWIEDCHSFYGPDDWRQMCLDCVTEVAALHRAGLMHRDIKTNNFVVWHGDDGRRRVKLIDFGSSMFGTNAVESAERTIAATAEYFRAPEVQEGMDSDGRGAYSFKSDVYSLGVVLFMAWAGRIPFAYADNKLVNGHEVLWGDDVGGAVRDLLEGMLEMDVARRLTIEQVLGHEFFAEPCLVELDGVTGRMTCGEVVRTVVCHHSFVFDDLPPIEITEEEFRVWTNELWHLGRNVVVFVNAWELLVYLAPVIRRYPRTVRQLHAMMGKLHCSAPETCSIDPILEFRILMHLRGNLSVRRRWMDRLVTFHSGFACVSGMSFSKMVGDFRSTVLLAEIVAPEWTEELAIRTSLAWDGDD